MLGRTGCISPHVIIKSDGSWLGTLVYIERITHRSSAHSEMRGKISLIGSPDWPHRLKRNGDIISPPVRRSVLRTLEGVCPLYRARAGLGSNVSTCDGPPFMKTWMMRLARGRKCGSFGASGLAGPSAS